MTLPSRRGPSNLSESLHHHLNNYALAASAAGVGMLASAPPAEAKVVYYHVHHVIGVNTNYKLDLNHDGVVDFILSNKGSCSGDLCGDSLFVVKERANGVAGQAAGHRSAYALSRGTLIGPKQPFLGRLMASCFSVNGGCSLVYGQWLNVTDRYLGFKFRAKGQTHYGWARLNVTIYAGLVTGTLTGYAYETTPNKPIIAGRTKGPDVVDHATLGKLALGRR
jgi:hypothetical protein